MKISLENVDFVQGKWSMDSFSIVFPGSLSAIVGPSGCGKTTVLRLIAGLESPLSGKILFDSKDVTGLPAEQRNIGLVFQNDGLFSHMDVLQNVEFGPRMKCEKSPKKSALEALKLVHLEGFENRNINSLSGGERKRVAIARALAFNPKVLLLDEPFSGLDANLKEKLKRLILELKEKTKLTIVLVTHDLDEAFFLADKIIVMNNGKKEQECSPIEIFKKPKTEFVKSFTSDYKLVEKSRPKFICLIKKSNFRKG